MRSVASSKHCKAKDKRDPTMSDNPATTPNPRNRRRLALLGILLLLLCVVTGLFVRYLVAPEPLPELIVPNSDLNYPPHYLFSIYGVDQPVGIALSPDNDQIYVAESGGERLIRVFNRDGDPLNSFAPPKTQQGERSPVYMATDSNGRLFVTDRLQHAIFVYDADGSYIDTLLTADLSLSEYIDRHVGGLQPNTTFAYNVFHSLVYYQIPGYQEETLPAPIFPSRWAPLGIRIDNSNNVYVTDVQEGQNLVHQFDLPAGTVLTSWYQTNQNMAAPFGGTGERNGELSYPNAAVTDSHGRIYVSDGNNGRIAVWDANNTFLYNFGGGNGEDALSLPRGIFIDQNDRLFVVDAVGQDIKVYNVSGEEPVFLHRFGDWGMEDGLFNYPNDIIVDRSGRLYIVDRENHRIQVWSY